jgi:hypothetical protein
VENFKFAPAGFFDGHAGVSNHKGLLILFILGSNYFPTHSQQLVKSFFSRHLTMLSIPFHPSTENVEEQMPTKNGQD